MKVNLLLLNLFSYLALAAVLGAFCTEGSKTFGYPHVIYPKVIASHVPFKVEVYFPPLAGMSGSFINGTTALTAWPRMLTYSILVENVEIRRGKIHPYGTAEEALGYVMPGSNVPGEGSTVICLASDLLTPPGVSPYGTIHLKTRLYQENEVEMNSTKEQSNKDSASRDSGTEKLVHESSGEAFGFPAWLSVLPSVLTVGVAVLLKQNLLALFIGAWLGASICYGAYNPIIGLVRLLDTVVIEAMADSEHAAVLYFCLFIGGMIAVIGRGGGAVGMASTVTRWAKTRRRGQLATFGIGVCTFFDDYASCLVAGATTRDFLGRQKTSREKSSFIVDTNAAAIPSLLPFSSWIGVELAFIADQLRDAGMDGSLAYDVFLQTLPFRFYPLLILTFSLTCILAGRDFGPMLRAERRALQTGQLVRPGGTPMTDSDAPDALQPKAGKPTRWINAVLPFAFVVVVIIGGILADGYTKCAARESALRSALTEAIRNGHNAYASLLSQQLDTVHFGIRDLFSAGSPYAALLWASFAGTATAILLVVTQGILTLDEAMDAWLNGTKSMLFALLILIHAWALGTICKRLQTSAVVAQVIVGRLPPGLLPAAVFLIGAAVSFSTGSAWGTMSILFPLMVPLALQMAPNNANILLGTIASILSGAVWGNHASPIADSCIMASLACAADHHDHVHTQAIYALLVGAIATIFCAIPSGLGWLPPWASLLLGLILTVLVVFLLGEPVDSSIPYTVTQNNGPLMVFLRTHTPLPRALNAVTLALSTFIITPLRLLFRRLIAPFQFFKWRRNRQSANNNLQEDSLMETTAPLALRSPSPVLKEHYLSATEPYSP